MGKQRLTQTLGILERGAVVVFPPGDAEGREPAAQLLAAEVAEGVALVKQLDIHFGRPAVAFPRSLPALTEATDGRLGDPEAACTHTHPEGNRHGTRTRDSGEPASQQRPNRRQMGTTSLRRSPLDVSRTAASFRRDSCWEIVGDVAREKGAAAARSPAITSPRRRLATSGTAGHIQIGAGSDESPPQCLLLLAAGTARA